MPRKRDQKSTRTTRKVVKFSLEVETITTHSSKSSGKTDIKSLSEPAQKGAEKPSDSSRSGKLKAMSRVTWGGSMHPVGTPAKRSSFKVNAPVFNPKPATTNMT